MKPIKKEKLQVHHDYWMQWYATIGVLLLMLQIGAYIGWSSPNVTRLLSKNSPIKMTSAEVSWLMSLMQIGGVIGAIVGSICNDYIGNKKTILLTFGLMSVSWLCLVIADSAIWLFLGRFIGGLPVSMLYCSPMFIGEISDPKIRGTLVSTAVAGIPLGTGISTIMETYLSMKVTSSIYLVTCAIGIVLFWWLKNSPYYLMGRGDIELAKESIQFYNPSCSVDKKLKDVRIFVESQNCQTFTEKIQELRNPVVKRSMLITITLFGATAATGMMVLLSYMETIFTDAGFNVIEPSVCVIYVNVICGFCASFSVNLVDLFGRRLLYVYSSLITTVAMIALGVHFYLISHGFDSDNMQWLPVLAILIFLAAYFMGFANVINTVLSEIFTENMKSLAVCVTTLSLALFGFITTKIFQPIVDSFGYAYAFWIFALLNVLGLMAVLSTLIETKGKTFQEIQDKLSNRK